MGKKRPEDLVDEFIAMKIIRCDDVKADRYFNYVHNDVCYMTGSCWFGKTEYNIIKGNILALCKLYDRYKGSGSNSAEDIKTETRRVEIKYL